ncbi:MAG TPA: PEP-CTERM sorting domain-containing protein [Croceibacterium sp.]|nr:PEP-CTERM sorting domain-containing protein [Croceibacterium sp.]
MNRAFAILVLIAAAPVHAQGATQVSEPSQLALVALGILGVLVGRNAAKRRNHDD